MPFIRNIWYVAAWAHDVSCEQPIGRTIAGEPIVLFRQNSGDPVALTDRCPHRHAPLSMGRIEGDTIRCMYHGLKFGTDGQCLHVPGTTAIPPGASARAFPCIERFNWIWVWTGAPEMADPALIPDVFGVDFAEWTMRSGTFEYAADYQLINDNLCDLSHLDFVHEKTLRAATNVSWSDEAPRITTLENGLFIERWYADQPGRGDSGQTVDLWTRYHYLLPGLFLQKVSIYPGGTARASNYTQPAIPPIFDRIDQQAVTPIEDGRARYLYAVGFPAAATNPAMMDAMFAGIDAAFAEDKAMIEAQQRVWDKTPPGTPMAFIPQDRAPAAFRRLITRRLNEEAAL